MTIIVPRNGDRVFEDLSTASATLITVFIAAIGIFLVLRAIPALNRNANGFLGFFTYTDTWNTSDVENMYFGIPNLFSTSEVSHVSRSEEQPCVLQSRFVLLFRFMLAQ